MGVNQWLKLITQKIREKKRKYTDSMKPRLAKEANSVAGLDKGPRFRKHDRQARPHRSVMWPLPLGLLTLGLVAAFCLDIAVQSVAI